MIIDTSAIISILRNEPYAPAFAQFGGLSSAKAKAARQWPTTSPSGMP
jgi:antitoxin VapB